LLFVVGKFGLVGFFAFVLDELQMRLDEPVVLDCLRKEERRGGRWSGSSGLTGFQLLVFDR
jgi:hypothetical protein